MEGGESLQTSKSYRIRPCTREDDDDLLNVSLKTGDGGNDATSFFNDPKILGYRFVLSYVHLCPDLCFALEDSEGNVCGFVVAALNSTVFYEQYVNEWLPKMKQLYPIIPSGKQLATLIRIHYT